MTIYFYKNIYVFISLKRGQSFYGTRETGRRRVPNIQTAILTHKFAGPYHTVLSSRPYVFSLDETCSLRTTCEPLASRCRNFYLSVGRFCWPRQDYSYITWAPVYIISQCWNISAQPLASFRLIYAGTSCAEKSLIDGLVKAQYAT